VRGERRSLAPEKSSRGLRQGISVIRGFFVMNSGSLLTNGYSDFSNAARDDEAFVEMDFQTKSDVNAAKFQKTTAKRTAGESCGSEFREESAATDQDVSSAARDHGDFIGTVFRPDSDGLHVPDRFELNSFGPIVGRPGIQ